MTVAEVTTIYPHNFRDTAKSLRSLADKIEAGNYGEVGTVAVVVMGDEMHVFGYGPDEHPSSVGLLFGAAHQRFLRSIEQHGVELGKVKP